MSRILRPRRDLIVPLNGRVGLRGYYKLEAVRPDGRVRPLTGWFPNLITDVGLNRMGISATLQACQVGTDNTTPTVYDTQLAGWRAGTTSLTSSTYGTTTSEPYYGYRRKTYRFGAGAASGNLAEVGVGTSTTTAAVLFSRALILDELGDPTTVTVLSDEYLDVTYELRLYPDTTEYTGTFTVSGSGDHDFVSKPSIVTNLVWSKFVGEQNINFDPYNGGTTLTVYNGALGTLAGSPSGSNYSVRPGTSAYGNNNLYRDGTGSFGLTQGNLAGGITAVRFQTTVGAFQYSVSPAIAKDGTNTLSITNRVYWSRYE